MKTVLITGIRNEFDKKLADVFAKEFTQRRQGAKDAEGNLGEEKEVLPFGSSADRKLLYAPPSGGARHHAEDAEDAEGLRVFVLGQNLSGDIREAAAALEKNGEHIDIYIDVSDERSGDDNFNVRSGINGKVIRELYDANVTRSMAMLEAFLPFLEKGEGKRLCYISSAEASINETRGTDGLGYKMAKAALANFLQITRNALAPKGYTIRAFDPLSAEVSPELAAEAAFNYFTRRRGIERGDANRDDEGNIVLRDALGRQHAW
jgi:NAD(P)-dependent dehydrogenase (short-subunit alcohol dehydrogenase family)